MTIVDDENSRRLVGYEIIRGSECIGIMHLLASAISLALHWHLVVMNQYPWLWEYNEDKLELARLSSLVSLHGNPWSSHTNQLALRRIVTKRLVCILHCCVHEESVFEYIVLQCGSCLTVPVNLNKKVNEYCLVTLNGNFLDPPATF